MGHPAVGRSTWTNGGPVGGGVFPFEFGGEAAAGVLAGGPLGVGGGLEEAEVADGGFGEVVRRGCQPRRVKMRQPERVSGSGCQ